MNKTFSVEKPKREIETMTNGTKIEILVRHKNNFVTGRILDDINCGTLYVPESYLVKSSKESSTRKIIREILF